MRGERGSNQRVWNNCSASRNSNRVNNDDACGMANHPTRKCVCTEAQCDRWVGRLGRIVADLGIDTIIEVPHLTMDKRANGERCPSTSDLLSAGGAK